MRINGQRQAVAELWEQFDRKFNPDDTNGGRRVANKEFAGKIMSLIESKKIDRDRIDFKELYTQLVTEQQLEENLDSSAFPVISGEIISSVIIEKYQAFPKTGLGLVRVVPSRLKVSQIPGWKAIGKIKQVGEREFYPEVIPPDEKTVTIRNRKYGGVISLSKEDIFFDQTGQLLNEAGDVGEETARFQDELILNKIMDVDSDAYSGAALYSSGNSNLLQTSASALGTTAFEAVHVSLTGAKDERNKPIWVHGERPKMLVGATLEPTAFKLKNNEYGPQGTAAQSDRSFAFNRFDYVLNPYQDAVSSTAWWYGGFSRQFRWEQVWPLETFQRTGQDTEDGFKRDVIMQVKSSIYGGCGATDTKYVKKNTGA